MRSTFAAVLGIALFLGLPLSFVLAAENCPPSRTGNAAGRESRSSSPRQGTRAKGSTSDRDDNQKKGMGDPNEIQITYAAKREMVTAYLGRTIAVRLPGNKDAGQYWQIAKLTGSAIKSQGSPEYVRNARGAERGTMAGVYIFRFDTVQLGRVSLKMVYLGPRVKDKKAAPLNTFLCEILVKQPR